MRTAWIVSLVSAAVMAAAVPAEGQGQKIGYLDSRRVLAEAPGAQQARTQIEAEMQRFQGQVQALEDSVGKMLADYQQKAVTMSPDARTKREAEITQARTALQQQAAQIEQQAVQKQNELMQPVMDLVEKTIEDVRKEGGYAIIFDLGPGAIVSADTTLDLTTTVISRLKASQSSSTARR
jgi:outer membrane protein